MAIVGRAKYKRARARNFEETRHEGNAEKETTRSLGISSQRGGGVQSEKPSVAGQGGGGGGMDIFWT